MRTATASVILLGVAWSGLYLMLAHGGHAPGSDRGLIVDGADYYRWAAMWALPTVLVLWQVFARTAFFVAGRLGGTGDSAATVEALGHTFALPLCVCLILPELILLTIFGHDAMKWSVRIAGPTAAFTLLFLSTRAVRRVHGLSVVRALSAVLAGWIAQSFVMMTLLR